MVSASAAATCAGSDSGGSRFSGPDGQAHRRRLAVPAPQTVEEHGAPGFRGSANRPSDEQVRARNDQDDSQEDDQRCEALSDVPGRGCTCGSSGDQEAECRQCHGSMEVDPRDADGR